MTRRRASLATWHIADSLRPPAKGPFVALVPGEEAPLLPVDLPDVSRESVRTRVARAQIDGMLGGDWDETEIYVSPPGDDGAAMVVSADRAREWRARLNGAGPGLRAVLPDYLAVDPVDGEWTLQVDLEGAEPRILARLGPANGFSANLPHALAQLRAVLTTGPRPNQVRLIGDAPHALQHVLDAAELKVEAVSAADPAFGPTELAFNLQRDKAADRAEIRAALRRWRMPMVALALGLAALAGALWIDASRIERIAAERRTDAQDLARTAFLPNTPILDLRQQVGRVIAARQQQLSENDAQSGPLDLFRRSAAILTENGASVTRIRQTSASLVRVELETDDFLSLDRLVAALNQGGVSGVVVSSEAAAGTGVTALIEITPAISRGAQ